jgi:hypothetical protein
MRSHCNGVSHQNSTRICIPFFYNCENKVHSENLMVVHLINYLKRNKKFKVTPSFSAKLSLWCQNCTGGGGSGVKFRSFLTPTLDSGGLSASHSGHFTPEERVYCTPWIGGWMGPTAGQDAVKRQNSCFCLESTTILMMSSPMTNHCTDSNIPAPSVFYVHVNVSVYHSSLSVSLNRSIASSKAISP